VSAKKTNCLVFFPVTLLYHLRKKMYITRRSEHHHYTYTALKKSLRNKALQHCNLGEELKVSHHKPRRRHQCCATSNAEQQLKLLHHGVVIPMPKTHDH
jgi:hypothetical protein